jgi:hypothetical protein
LAIVAKTLAFLGVGHRIGPNGIVQVGDGNPLLRPRFAKEVVGSELAFGNHAPNAVLLHAGGLLTRRD